ncbi:MAG: helix-turn-helix transcriptional regulator [Rhodospirillales bacterium]|nr:helix-turn-helix transcriptional regulator [Rhodospirillales bacterium]
MATATPAPRDAAPHPLDAWRRAKGLTKEQLGAALGCDGATVSRYISGRRLPAPKIMQRIFEVTAGQVQPNDFYALPPDALVSSKGNPT